MGGGERQLLALLVGSIRRGVDARLIVRSGSPCAKAAAEAGVPVMPLRVRFSYDPFAARDVVRYLKDQPADVLHLHDGGSASIGVMAAQVTKTPVIVHRRIASPLRKTLFTRLKYHPSRVGKFIAVSGVARDVLLESGIPGEKVVVVPSGIDLPAMDLIQRSRPEPADGRLLGTIGKLAPKKGADVVLRAFASIHNSIPKSRLLVVGDGPLLATLQQIASEINISESVLFTGNQPDAKNLLATMDLFLFASELEGSPGVVREAMALQVPIVAVDAPGTVEVVGGTGRIVPRGDATAMARAAVELLQNPDAAKEMANKARQRVEQHYSMGSMVDGTLAVARSLIGR